MADAFTSNRNIIQPQVGGDSGTWGGLLNSGVSAQLDLILGATQAKTMTGSDVTLTTAEWNNVAIKLTGTLTGNHNLVLPFVTGSITTAVGGVFVVDNQTSGAFSVTVLTEASGSTGVIAYQGVRTFLYSDGTNVYYADDARLQIIPYAGNPNSHVAGTAAAVNKPPSAVWDYTNFILYVCTTTGNAAAAVWTNSASSAATLGTPQGYLTPVSNTPIIVSDSVSATVIYYTPYLGATAVIHNGSSIVPYTFSQMQLTLSPSQAANNIYDVFLAYNGGSPVIGTGPTWTAGGGSVTAGSCARGTGAGSTQISRASPSGFWVNTVSMSLIWNTGTGNTTITVGAGQGIYLGSIWIDAAAGQVTCHRSFGQSRKWGISNAYNRTTTYLKAGDSTASWTYSSTTIRASNGSAANSLQTFSCLPEDEINVTFFQGASGNNSGSAITVGIGFNSTSAFSGTTGSYIFPANNPSKGGVAAQYEQPPVLGINTFTCLESSPALSSNFYGSENYMSLIARWRA